MTKTVHIITRVSRLETSRGFAVNRVSFDPCRCVILVVVNAACEQATLVIANPFHRERQVIDLLKSVSLKPTRQRIAIACLLFTGEGKHTTADMLCEELRAANEDLVLATVYNTLQTLVRAGLLRPIFVKGLTFFDTNPAEHQNFFIDRERRLIDVSSSDVAVVLPEIPEGYEVHRVDVLIHLARKSNTR